ncbi:hypothetical protein M878_01125 [Streptomyces roseochromogenus subsp. oscitans DS 12.976]|uniref:Uncharacterized protein n=1 Tax=Streptomyces roseochromogenus subsp. oscitans DS 12.976 TaxID=1352936 RepID=V6KWH1_STRRC|nr:hypothetical protein M878_01125 [Streptomyces roseochromogenus subsp. oscitans DS 12.976]
MEPPPSWNIVWHFYGASTSRKPEVQANNTIQWRMVCDAYELGARINDFRGITDTLDEGNHLPVDAEAGDLSSVLTRPVAPTISQVNPL